MYDTVNIFLAIMGIHYFLARQVVEVPNVSWQDIGGLDNVKRELQEVCT